MDLFTVLLYQPIYNLLVFLVDVVPGGDIGVAVILATVLVKVLLVPVSVSAMKTQAALKEVAPQIKKLQEEYKADKETQARKLLELYAEHKIRPFSSLLLILIQIPIVLALYFVFTHERFPVISLDMLYPFVPAPETVSVSFLGVFDVTSRSIFLALLAGAIQYLQLRILMRNLPPADPTSNEAKMMQDVQKVMTFAMPVLIVAVSFGANAVVALYFATSSAAALLQEVFVRKLLKKREIVTP